MVPSFKRTDTIRKYFIPFCLNDNLKLIAEARIFKETSNSDPANVFRKDDYVQVELEYYF